MGVPNADPVGRRGTGRAGGAPKCVPLVMRHGTKTAKTRVPQTAPTPNSSRLYDKSLTPALEKAILHLPIVHRLLRDFLEYAPSMSVEDAVDTLS